MERKKTSSCERDLEAYLREKRSVVEEALDRFLPEASSPPARLHQAMRHSVFSGGKRLRPILTIAAFELAGGRGDCVLAPACATELIHTYSLIHDDLPPMDDDCLRRGRPTCHCAFDEATAILAGDGLLTLAFEIVAREEDLSAAARLAIVRELAVANGTLGMVGGQSADIEGEGATPSLDRVAFIHRRKTAMPIEAAAVVGALAAEAPDAVREALASYGRSVGLAFQIVDDILDVTGSQEEMGKAVGKDEERGKMTYPAVVGRDRAAARAQELADEAVAALSGFGADAWVLSEVARYVVARRS